MRRKFIAAVTSGVLALTVEPVGGAVTLWQRVLHAMQAPFKTACRRRMAKKVKKCLAFSANFMKTTCIHFIVGVKYSRLF